MARFRFGVPVSHANEPAWTIFGALPLTQLNGMQPLLMLVSTPVFAETEYIFQENTKWYFTIFMSNFLHLKNSSKLTNIVCRINGRINAGFKNYLSLTIFPKIRSYGGSLKGGHRPHILFPYFFIFIHTFLFLSGV